MLEYRTITDEAESFYEIQKSKFITHIKHVTTEEEAQEYVKAMKKKYFDARHNCSAYVLGENSAKQKSNDDGEPGGTAGNPILEAIKKNELTDVVVVVTRYFGGVKLGAGGLIRAYSHSAVLGIEASQKIQMTPFRKIAITFDYSLLSTIENYLRQQEIKTADKIYTEAVTLKLLLKPANVDEVLTEVTNLTAANFTSSDEGEILVPIEI